MIMRRLFYLLFPLALYLTFPTPAMSAFYYVIQLRNGGTLATPLYWSEGTQVYFFYAGGTVGVEETTIAGVERRESETNVFVGSTGDGRETKESSPEPSPSPADKSPGPEKSSGEVEQKPSMPNAPDADKKENTNKDPNILREFKELQTRFESRKSLTVDELKVLKNDLTVLRDKIVSNRLKYDFLEEVNKLADMRFFTNDLLIIKSKSQ